MKISNLNHTAMIIKKIFKKIRALQVFKAAPIFLLSLLMINMALAQTAAPEKPASEFPYFEVFGSIAMIIVLILIAWFFGAKQSQNKPSASNEYHPANARRQFHHPNDPHFRKIMRKTS